KAKCCRHLPVPEAPTFDLLKEYLDLTDPAFLQHGVGMKEKQPVAPRRLRPRRKLLTASLRHANELCASRFDYFQRFIGGAAIDHDHLPHKPLHRAGHEGCQCACESFPGIQGRNDDAQHSSHNSDPCAAANRGEGTEM